MRSVRYYVARLNPDGSRHVYEFPNRMFTTAVNRASVLAGRPPAEPLVFIPNKPRLWIAEGDDGQRWAIAAKEM